MARDLGAFPSQRSPRDLGAMPGSVATGERKNTVNVGGVPLSVAQKEKAISARLSPFQNFGVGLAKGAASTVKGLGTVGEKIGTSLGLPVLGGQETLVTGTPEEIALREQLTPSGGMQTAGLVTEKIAESVLPGKVLSGADKALAAAIPSTAGRITARTALDAGAQGALGYIQSGGDVEAAKQQAVFSGTLKGVTSTLGEVVKKTNLPTHLYQTILKDPVLAKEAKNRGLQGSLSGMADEVKDAIPRMEQRVIAVADATDTRVPINPKLSDVFDAMSKDLSGLADDALSVKAKALADAAKAGDVDMKTALEMRRFLDSEIAYTKSGLAPKGDRVLKSFADDLRGKINATDLGKVMKDYSFYLKTGEALRNEAKRAGNREVVGLFDTILFGSGIASGDPVGGLVVAGTQKAARSPYGRTALAQFLEKLPDTSSRGSALKSGISQFFTSMKEGKEKKKEERK